MKKFIKHFEDLRFMIGLLFMIFGVILIVLGMTRAPLANHLNLNLGAGLAMAVFATVMLSLVYQSPEK